MPSGAVTVALQSMQDWLFSVSWQVTVEPTVLVLGQLRPNVGGGCGGAVVVVFAEGCVGG